MTNQEEINKLELKLEWHKGYRAGYKDASDKSIKKLEGGEQDVYRGEPIDPMGLHKYMYVKE